MAGDASRRNGRLGGKPKGSKHWKTIKKEELDAHYEEEARKRWAQIVDVHLEEAVNPANLQERKLAIEQVRGKAREKVEHTGEMKLAIDV